MKVANLNIDKKALIEAVKEVGRIAFLAALAAVLLWLGDLINTVDPTSMQYIILTIILKFGDKYVAKNKKIDAKGIAPF